MKKKLLICMVLFLMSTGVLANDLAGLQMANTAQVGEQTLELNGAGIRSKWFFKVYVAALYLPQKQTSATTIIAGDHDYRIALHMLRDLSSKKLLGAFNDAIEANHTPAELKALQNELKQMNQIFEAVQEVKTDDVITLDYLPTDGTRIKVNGTSRGKIVGTDFARALLKIWLGNKPAQDDLKQELLGG